MYRIFSLILNLGLFWYATAMCANKVGDQDYENAVSYGLGALMVMGIFLINYYQMDRES